MKVKSNIIKKLIIKASNDKINWEVIFKLNSRSFSKENYLLHKDPTLKRDELIWNVRSGYKFYRLIFSENEESLLDKEFNFLFKKGCV